MSFEKNSKLFFYFFFTLYLIIGLSIYQDFGVGIEEHFQRRNGFYWLKYVFSFSGFENFNLLINTKYKEILSSSPDLPDPVFFNFYGIVFDLPLAFIETFFEINSSKAYFELRHLFNFLIFFVSSIFFYKILKNRFLDEKFALMGSAFFIFTPRIFGDSFHNNKDILFLSLLTIAIYYLFKLIDKFNYGNLFLFCIFGALATSTRIMGIYLPILLIFFYLLEYLSNKKNLKSFLSDSLKVFFLFIIFLYMHYPYMWNLNILEFKKWFSSFFYYMDLKILFNGDYYNIKYLPRSYLPTWIFISTPTYVLVLFIFGFSILIRRFFLRALRIKTNLSLTNDFWTSNSEMKDLFILISLLSFFCYAIFLNVAMLSGWRHFYFLHVFIIYIFVFALKYFYINFRNQINIKTLIYINLIVITFLLHELYKYHPFQSLYFNNLVSEKYVKKFQVDSPSLSRSDALKFVAKDTQSNKIYIANTSWTPLYNGKDMLIEEDKKKFVFVGQELQLAEYIYTNNIYKSNEKFNKKYKIPINFKKIIEYKKDNFEIYSIFKKKIN